eukprot:CAMPEP_0116876350 /NCGR_PEP_ID=MMETSP0463-20121206/8309_1 /TAXON_ID=181622 /ORGANISM="Strombidinopsis sp, Strain SopsisLIS2011" /LENGTH=56 /DNA_ID=CAMNT_0004522901 /DNA_START=243 /DNA_END=413 /DNA_ORIENTATION=+
MNSTSYSAPANVEIFYEEPVTSSMIENIADSIEDNVTVFSDKEVEDYSKEYVGEQF